MNIELEIKDIKHDLNYAKKCEYDHVTLDVYKVQVLLTDYENQQKEIEELKKEYERVRAGRNWLSEHISAQIATPELFDRIVEENYISKNKIKAKIEEVEQWELYNMKIPKLNTLDERLGAKIGIKYVLQLLLKEE